MLVLTRKKDQTLVIGDHIEITVLDIQGDQIRLGIDAPKSIKVFRKEIYLEIQEENKQAARARGLTNTSTASAASAASAAMESTSSPFVGIEHGGTGNAVTEADTKKQNAEAKQEDADAQQSDKAVSLDVGKEPEPDNNNPEADENAESGKPTAVMQREQPTITVRAEAGSTIPAQVQTQEDRPERASKDAEEPGNEPAATPEPGLASSPAPTTTNKPLTMMGRLLAEKEKE